MSSVSVIIPCFNGAEYLPELTQSLVAIGSEASEIILVDDGSTDSSAELFVKRMPGADVITQMNRGVAAARNTGAKIAHGEFLQLLDVDDIILPGKLSAQVAFAHQYGLDIVYSDWRMVIVDDRKAVREPLSDQPMPCEPVAALLGGWWVPPHAYLIRRSAYWDVGGSDDTLVNAQDFDLVLRLAIAGKKFGHLPGHFADYYRHLQSTSLARGPRRQYWSDYDRAVKKALRLLESRQQLTPERKKAAARTLHAVARNVYDLDISWYRRLMDEVFHLDSEFRPTGSRAYRIFSRVAGYNIAERLTSLKRRCFTRES